MVDFLQKAEFLKIELQEFYQQLRQGGNRAAKEAALSRLRAAVGKVEAFAEDPGYEWEHLSLAQRWGYLQLVFHVERASDELKQQRSARSYQACGETHQARQRPAKKLVHRGGSPSSVIREAAPRLSFPRRRESSGSPRID